MGPKCSNLQSGSASASNIYSSQFLHRHMQGHPLSIGIGLRQGMTVGQATLIHENLQSVSALATNSYLWQMTKCFSISSPHLFTAIYKVRWHWQKNIWLNTPCIYMYLLWQEKNKGIRHRPWHPHQHQHQHECWIYVIDCYNESTIYMYMKQISAT